MLIADDETLMRSAYVAFFAKQPDIEVVSVATNGREAVELYLEHRPDVVLMDLQMPVLSGSEATAEICQADPDACVVALTTFGSPDHIIPALRAGASGYLLKDIRGQALLVGIRQALNGDMPLAGPVRRVLVDAVAPARTTQEIVLSDRELELIGLLAQGLSNLQIASRMFVSEGSVKQYLNHVGAKFGCKSRTQILMRAVQHGFVDPSTVDVAS